jgi:peroxiredoxin
VVDHLDGLAESYPEAAEDLAATRFMVENLMLGREAPDIVGKDLDGVEFRLSDYRGKVVAIVFTGQWCGPCRSEYPYQRLLLEVMDPEEFVLLGVNSDADIEVAKQGKADAELDYRAWWDGYAEENTKGPIATQWNVTGWPTIYVLDENGVIRRRGPRQEKLITAAKELVAEMNSRQAEGGDDNP